METQFSRTEKLLGKSLIEKLASSRILVFGVGGVGGYVVEALARSGIGALDIVDDDMVALSNINRQIIATHQSLGQAKVEVAASRVKDINPDIKVTCHQLFYLPDSKHDFDFSKYDYIVDAIDTVSAKIDIIVKANEFNTPIISAMGCGNRFDPTKLVETDIFKTEMDPLAKVMRKELKKRGIKKLKVVYSTEPPIKHVEADTYGTMPTNNSDQDNGRKKSTPGSTAFVPPAAGLIIASIVVRELSGFNVISRGK